MELPYIGITGLKTADEIEKIARIYDRYSIRDNGFDGMMGFLCDAKNIHDPRREGRKSPALNNLPALLAQVPSGYMGMIHYYTDDADDIFRDSARLPEAAAIQYNVDWPSVKSLGKIQYDRYRKIVMQLQERAISALNNAQIARLAQAYDGIASYVLIDMSEGKGIEMDEEKTADLLHELSQRLHDTRVGVAGGLSDENVASKIRAIIGYSGIDRFCIDAQGRLRTEDVRSLDMDKAERYVANAMEAFR